MQNPQVKYLGNHAIQISWNISSSEWVIGARGPQVILLNLGPMIRVHKLEAPFVLQHWQALPVGHRTYGYYYVARGWADGVGKYHSLQPHELYIEEGIRIEPLALRDEEYIGMRPTAMNLMRGDLIWKNGMYHLSPA